MQHQKGRALSKTRPFYNYVLMNQVTVILIVML